ncbi:MAG: alpha/beta fold hydrolase [Actinomycetota bacterium]
MTDSSTTRGTSRPLRLGDPEVHAVRTPDNVELRLTRHKGGPKGPVILAPGYGTSTLALATPTVETNFPEYLYERGYDVWLFDYRASPVLPSAATQYSADEIATHDWPTAVKAVIDASGAGSVQVGAHCIGSMTLNMALAAGMKGVRSAISSQVALHPKVVPMVRAKAVLRLATLLKLVGAKTLSSNYSGSAGHRAMDLAMHLWPTHERCDSPVCRRILFLYGEVFRHDYLNDETHATVPEMFGIANLTFFEHVSRICAAGRVVDAQGEDTYLSHVDNMDLPITWVHGERNNFFPPVGTKMTYDLLSKVNGPDLYRRVVVPGYAHMDFFIGRDAHRDIFPLLHEDMERFN